jgi:hypothetical protein
MKIFEVANLLYNTEDKKLGEMFFVSKMKMRRKFNRNHKEPKGNAKDGNYCPKDKFGQSWAYTKDVTKGVTENVANEIVEVEE